jgi:hypothetical protein
MAAQSILRCYDAHLIQVGCGCCWVRAYACMMHLRQMANTDLLHAQPSQVGHGAGAPHSAMALLNRGG